jgi:hypothetical protein
MRTACSNRHLAYYSWRLQVFRSLAAQTLPSSHRDFSFLHPHHHNSNSRSRRPTPGKPSQNECPRQYTSYGHGLADEGRILNVEKKISPGKATAIKIQQKREKKKALDDHQLLQDLDVAVSALTDLAAKLAKEHAPSQEATPLDAWDRSQSDLLQNQDELPPQLLTKSQRVMQELEPEHGKGVDPVISALHKSPALKKFPVVRDRKLEPTIQEDRLRRDPWARMLAGAVRQCASTGIRIPAPLLADWNLVNNPEDGATYLLPSRLAELSGQESVRSCAERQKVAEQGGQKVAVLSPQEQHVLDQLAERLQLSLPEPREDITPTSTQEKLSRSTSRTILYDNLLDFIGAKKSHPLLFRSHQKFADAQHFRKQRASFADATGQELGPEPVEATLNMRDILLQKDIRQRLGFILRKRVLRTFEEILKLQASLSDQGIAMVSTIRARKVFEILEEQQRMDADVPSPALSSTDANGALVCQDATPRILLYLGPRSNHDSETPAALSFLTQCNDNTNPQVPLMLPSLSAASSQAFPVFPIDCMLDENQLDNFLEALERYSVFSAEMIDTISRRPNEAHFIMFKAGTENQSMAFERFARDIWRLWRYGGGRRWLETEGK